MVSIRKYFCTKCKRYHYRGKIYKKHKKYKKDKKETKKKKQSYLKNGLIKFKFKDLRPIAQRQIINLLEKMKETNNREMYIEQINRVVHYENKNY